MIDLILWNLRSTYNVGAIFRTADCFGINKIHLVGTTPAPTDRFGRPVERLAKVALGAEQAVPWQQYESLTACITELRQNSYNIVALEQAETAIDLQQFSPVSKTAVILGEETQGLPEDILQGVDMVVEIPMTAKSKESLNVAAAAAIMCYQLQQKKRT